MRAALPLSDPAHRSPADGVNELPRAVVLNSFRLRCPGAHHVTRLPRPENREARKALERELGVSLFGGEKAPTRPVSSRRQVRARSSCPAMLSP